MTSTRRETPFRTESLDLAAYLSTAGFEPQVSCPQGSVRALFTFDGSRELTAAVLQYEQGGQLPAKRLLNRRSWLFREAGQAVQKRGRHE